MKTKKASSKIRVITSVSLLLLSLFSEAASESLKCDESFIEESSGARATDQSSIKSSPDLSSESLIEQAIWQYKSLVLQVTLLKQSSSASSSSIAALNSEIASRKDGLLKAGVSKEALVLTQEDREALAAEIQKQTKDTQVKDSKVTAQTQAIETDGDFGEWEFDKSFEKHTGRVRDFSQNGRFMATENMILDMSTGRDIKIQSIDDDVTQVVKFSPDSKYLATISNKSVHLWDVVSGRHIRTFGKVLIYGDALEFSRDGKLLLANFQNRAVLFEVENGQELGWMDRGYTNSAVLSPDGMTIAHGRYAAITIANILTQEVIGKLDVPNHLISAIVFSKDGKIIATTSSNQSITFWDVSTRKQSLKAIEKKWSTVVPSLLAFTSKGDRLLVSYSNGALREYGLKNDHEIVLYPGEGKEIVDMTLSEDDQILYVTWRVSADYPHTDFVTRRWKLKSTLR